MILPPPLKKLWIKIAVPTALIAWVSVEIVVRISLQESLDSTQQAVRNNLLDIVSLAASQIDGDLHSKALQDSAETNPYFDEIRNTLIALRERIDFNEHWYTLTPGAGATASFGVMTHPEAFSGDRYTFRDSAVYRLFERAITTLEPQSTGIYKSDNGVWISAFAPIINSAGEGVAALEVDMSYSDFMAEEDEIISQANTLRIIGFLFGGVLGMLVGVVIARPIRTVSEAVNKIADNDFQGSIQTPLALRHMPDETASLIFNVNQMASRLQETLSNLREANMHLETLDSAKSVFLQFIAHELRTPIMGLQSLRVIPEMQELNADATEMLEGARLSAERLQKFSLDAERYIKALTHTPDFSVVASLNESAQAIVQEKILEYDASAIPVDFECDEDYVPVAIPYFELEQILTPILRRALESDALDNALSISIRCTDYEVKFSIGDRGHDFKPAWAQRIFEPFFVSDIEHHSQSTGVDMAIAKILVEHYRGAISAHSSLTDRGSVFTITFPIDRAAQEHRLDMEPRFNQAFEQAQTTMEAV